VKSSSDDMSAFDWKQVKHSGKYSPDIFSKRGNSHDPAVNAFCYFL